MRNRVRASCAKYERPDYFVHVEQQADAPDPTKPWAYAVAVATTEQGVLQVGSCATRDEAHACAHSTLRGMIALARLRALAP